MNRLTTVENILAANIVSELSYLSPEAAAEAEEREAFLMSCAADEIADAAEFFALVVEDSAR